LTNSKGSQAGEVRNSPRKAESNDRYFFGGTTVTDKDTDKDKDPRVQGEGDYRAARRHRRDVEQFVATSDTEQLAREAAPRSEAEHQEMLDAERQGKAGAKGGKPGNRPNER